MKKIIIRLFTIAIILGLLSIAFVVATNIYIIKSTQKYILNNDKLDGINTQCVMALGAGVVNNQPTLMLKDRIDQSISIYSTGHANKIIMSGDHGQTNYDEVNVMKRYAIDSVIPSEDIFMDHAGFSTYESMYRARDVFAIENMIIVTQDYHMYRAVYNARKLGIEAYGVNTAIPGNHYFGQNFRDIREVIARTKDFIYCIFKPLPTFLGDVIPITGSGDLTND